MPKMTITEALSELRTVERRIQSKQSSVQQFLFRQENLKDPLTKDGTTSPAYVKAELQAIRDLEDNKLRIRRAIQTANDVTLMTVAGVTRSMSDWLVWKRDVMPGRQSFYGVLSAKIQQARATITARGGRAVPETEDTKPGDIIVNVSETELAGWIEELQAVVETLDGQFSLKNATVVVEW